ncbi:hypothetical protein [Solitalea koreensis]|uniref:Uncharacterized protein n=1 Tax=Solitalea koreensis TaxID=543615 RepID=A0A521DA33_9SPHI|nr:hypothetical protein [Solitalea koreensis]SMO68574.1 hypothetical protein SAMN06265350_106135 [Solitalea koreensis]
MKNAVLLWLLAGLYLGSCSKSGENTSDPLPALDVQHQVSNKVWKLTKINNEAALYETYIKVKDSSVVWYISKKDTLTNTVCFKKYNYKIIWLNKDTGASKVEVLKNVFEKYDFESMTNGNMGLTIHHTDGSVQVVELNQITNVVPENLTICSETTGE